MARPICTSLAASLLAVMVGACSGGTQLPALPELPGKNEPLRAPGRVTDVYMRIAHGAATCWFGADGALKRSHIFHADVDPPSRGETAQVTVHEIEPGQTSPWGRRAFRVQLAPADGATSIAVENIAMPEEVANRMRADVFEWIEGKSACATKEAAPLSQLPAKSGSPPRQPGPAPTPPAATPRAL